jgi:hypothetical protein
MTQYLSILGLYIVGLIGLSMAPVPTPLANSLHFSDGALGPLLALISPTHDALVPASTRRALASLSGAQTWRGKAYSPPFDDVGPGAERNYSGWVEDGLSVGGMQIREARVGGPALNNQSFSPAVVQWRAAAEVIKYISVGLLLLSLFECQY